MATRIAFSAHYPDRMGELAGKPTRFPEKIVAGLVDERVELTTQHIDNIAIHLSMDGFLSHHPKTTTIRKNYEYWKSKEGQLIQPFFWAGKPYRSTQVVFCPEVRLVRVSKINIKHGSLEPGGEIKPLINLDGWYIYDGHGVIDGTTEMSFEDLVRDEGFDHPDHFWMWFDSDFDGALLEFERVKL